MELSLRRGHALVVKDCAFSHKIYYVTIFLDIFFYLEGHLNCFIFSKVTAILLNKGILPSGRVALRRVCACSLHSRLVCFNSRLFFVAKQTSGHHLDGHPPLAPGQGWMVATTLTQERSSWVMPKKKGVVLKLFHKYDHRNITKLYNFKKSIH